MLVSCDGDLSNDIDAPVPEPMLLTAVGPTKIPEIRILFQGPINLNSQIGKPVREIIYRRRLTIWVTSWFPHSFLIVEFESTS